MKLIFEQSKKGRRGYKNPTCDVDVSVNIPDKYLRRSECGLPEVSELDVVRHYTILSQKNYCVDTHFYPLGSCTMKYNPKFTEALAGLDCYKNLHPLLPQLKHGETYVQGALQVMYELEEWFCEMTGFSAFTMQPLAGAHGELTGVMMMAAYHKSKGNQKTTIIVPDASHGTNPATAAIAGYEIVSVPTKPNGTMDLEKLAAAINSETAGLMMTNPDTHGIFNSDIDTISKMIHAVDGIMYYDGANLNAILGRCRPGDLGFDVMHINTHKTFTTPHGGGGPGAGPVGVSKKLEPFLPISRVVKESDGTFALNYDYPQSIGYVAALYGNFAILLRAYAYILLLGREGLIQTSNHAVLNANYLKERLRERYKVGFDRICMHECVLSADNQEERGVHAIDIAKYLIDQGFHPPTVYFPLTVHEAIMIEPTETESKDMLDAFIEVMFAADDLTKTNPKAFKNFPQTTPVCRPDEVKAARDLNVNYFLNVIANLEEVKQS